MKNCRSCLSGLGVLALVGLATARPAHATLLTSFSFTNANTYFVADGGVRSGGSNITSSSSTSTVMTFDPTLSTDSYDNKADGPSATKTVRDPALEVFDLAVDGTKNQGKYFQFQLDTTGYKNIILGLTTKSVDGGFASGNVQYSVNGTTFVPLSSFNTTSTYTAVTPFDFSSKTALNNISTAYFRIVLNGGSQTVDTSSILIDNLTVNGTITTPEPSTYAMMALGMLALGIIGGRRKRSEDETAI